MKPASLTYILMLIFTPVAWAASLEEGRDLARQHGCVTCHGYNGISEKAKTPNLAGQKIKYMQKQIDSFVLSSAKRYRSEKISERTHPEMDEILKKLSREEIDLILIYYAKLPCRTPFRSKSVTIPEEAKRCEICHGGVRSGPFVGTPNLAGQREDYILQQLLNMARGVKNKQQSNSRYHRMAEIMLEGMSWNELKVAANYYANLSCR